MAQIILCSGGARSGKSEFAEKLALSLPGRRAYIATAQILDDEMRSRVTIHQARRGDQWDSYELPLNLAEGWAAISATHEVILVDCLTMYVTNQIMTYPGWTERADREKIEAEIVGDMERLLSEIKKNESKADEKTATERTASEKTVTERTVSEKTTSEKTVIFVTNELGLGIVPENALARLFRDVAGKVNRLAADAADQVYLTISGISIEIKSKGVHING